MYICYICIYKYNSFIHHVHNRLNIISSVFSVCSRFVPLFPCVCFFNVLDLFQVPWAVNRVFQHHVGVDVSWRCICYSFYDFLCCIFARSNILAAATFFSVSMHARSQRKYTDVFSNCLSLAGNMHP